MTLPNEIKYLIKLEVLNISFNIISSLPRTLSQLISLRDFNASNNEIRIFPDQLAGIKKVYLIYLFSIYIHYTICNLIKYQILIS